MSFIHQLRRLGIEVGDGNIDLYKGGTFKVSGNQVAGTQGATVADPAAITAETLGGTLTGTPDQTLADIGDTSSIDGSAAINKNTKELQAQVNALKADVTAVRTALVAVLARLEAHGLLASS